MKSFCVAMIIMLAFGINAINVNHVLSTAMNNLIYYNCDDLRYTFTKIDLSISKIYLFDYDLLQCENENKFKLNYTVSSNHNITIQNKINLYDDNFLFTFVIDNMTVSVNDINESLKINSYNLNRTLYKNGIVSMFSYFREIKDSFDLITNEINVCMEKSLEITLNKVNQLTTDFFDIINHIKNDYYYKEVFFIITDIYAVKVLNVDTLKFNLQKSIIIDKNEVDLKDILIEFDYSYSTSKSASFHKGTVVWNTITFKGKNGALYSDCEWTFEETSHQDELKKSFHTYFIGVFHDYFFEFYKNSVNIINN